ncbi:MAG: zinc ribbon domain-containing protein [Planctomycetota bacterium]|jgi:hypothetical protein
MKITCPHCEKTINAPDKYAGRVVKCPGCGGEMELPSLEELQAAAPPPEPPPPPPPPPQQAAPPPPQKPSTPPPPPAPEEETEDFPGPEAGEEPEPEQEPEEEPAAKRPSSRRKGSKRKSSRRSRRGGDDDGDDSGGVSDREQRKAEAALGSYRRNMVIMGLLMLLLAGMSAVCALFALGAGVLGALGAAAGEVAMEHGAIITTAETGAPVGAESGSPIGALQALAAMGFISAMVFAGCAGLNFILSFCAFFKANFANYLGLVANLALAGLSGYLITVIGPPLAVVTGPAAIVVLLAFLNIKARGKINAAGLSLSGGRGGRSRGRRSRSGDDEDEPKGSRRRRTGSRSRSRRR